MSESRRRSVSLVAVMLLALLGAADGLYLTLVHLDYEVGRPGLAQVCHALASQGCSVTAGRFGDIAGLPVSIVGFGGMLATAALAGWALTRRGRYDDPIRGVVWVLAAGAAMASVVMAALSFVEGSFCPFCVIWYGINAAIAWFAYRATEDDAPITALWRQARVPAIAALVVLGGGVAAGQQIYESRRHALLEERKAFIAAFVDEVRAAGKVEVDVPDAPSHGPEDAEVTVVEFSDFECPFCKRLWDGLIAYDQTTTHTVRVVFAHYPLDEACNPHVDTRHPHACMAAAAAVCAAKQNAFWNYGDLLFQNQRALTRDDLLDYANRTTLEIVAFTTCLDDPATMDKVRADVELGERLGVAATPTFYVNGYMFKGALPPPVLEAVIDQLLQ